jgi:hypothetical protein
MTSSLSWRGERHGLAPPEKHPTVADDVAYPKGGESWQLPTFH